MPSRDANGRAISLDSGPRFKNSSVPHEHIGRHGTDGLTCGTSGSTYRRTPSLIGEARPGKPGRRRNIFSTRREVFFF